MFVFIVENVDREYWGWWHRTAKNSPAKQEIQVRSLGQKDPLKNRMTTQSHFLAWRIPWTEELGGLQSMRSQRVGHD